MNPSKPKALLRCLIFSYLLSGILLLALSFALYKWKLKESQINMAVYVVYLIACLVGGILAGKAIRVRCFFWGLASGFLYFLLLIVLSWLMNHGAAPDLTRSLTVLSCCLAGGMLGGMIS